MTRFLGLLAAVNFSAAPSAAATLTVNAGGELTGASGVNVNGSLFDVTFTDERCDEILDGCDDVSDFTFQTESQALAAANALLDQVLIDGPQGNFDTGPDFVFGCSFPLGCVTFIPYAPVFNVFTRFAFASNRLALNGIEGPDTVGVTGIPRDNDFAGANFANLAVFRASSIVSPVPEPAAWVVMLLGFGFLGAFMRSSQRRQKLSVSYR